MLILYRNEIDFFFDDEIDDKRTRSLSFGGDGISCCCDDDLLLTD